MEKQEWKRKRKKTCPVLVGTFEVKICSEVAVAVGGHLGKG